MKKNIIFILISVLLLTACDKALERYPLNGPSTGTFPASEEEALSGVKVRLPCCPDSGVQFLFLRQCKNHAAE